MKYPRQPGLFDVEKPDAVILHAGICDGQSGNWLSYLDVVGQAPRHIGLVCFLTIIIIGHERKIFLLPIKTDN